MVFSLLATLTSRVLAFHPRQNSPSCFLQLDSFLALPLGSNPLVYPEIFTDKLARRSVEQGSAGKDAGFCLPNGVKSGISPTHWDQVRPVCLGAQWTVSLKPSAPWIQVHKDFSPCFRCSERVYT